MTNLYPTIILGIGSFGGEVVSHLRTLVYEELGVPGLPIFRFVHISTHEQDEVKPKPANHEGKEIWEALQVFKATLPESAVKRMNYLMEDDQPITEVDPGWREWVDKNILTFPASAYEAGASNNRMIGRACLWSNWRGIKSALSNMVQQILLPESEIRTNTLLHNYYINKNIRNRRDQPNYVETGHPRVYIVGSLCGGTGSGMLLDLAYFFRTDDRLGSKNFGIFSIPDRQSAKEPGKERLAANCMAALMEIDFFMHNHTRYEAQMPGDTTAISNPNTPFDYIQLVSPSSKLPKARRSFTLGDVTVANSETIKELTHSCATSMFFELLSGTGGRRATLYADYFSRYPQWRRPRTIGPGYLQMFSGFGATAAHYPKYRIAGAAAAHLLQKKFLGWSGKEMKIDPVTQEAIPVDKPRNEAELRDIAQQWFYKAYDNCRSIMARGRREKRLLINEWEDEFKNFFFPNGRPLQWNADELRRNLGRSPEKAPFSERFVEGSEYERMLRERLEKFLQAMFEQIREMYLRTLETILQDRADIADMEIKDLAQLNFVLTILIDEKIGGTISGARSPASSPVSLGKVTPILDEFNRVENSLAVTASFSKDCVRDYYRDKAINEYLKSLRDAHFRMEDAVIARALPGLQEILTKKLRSSLSRLSEKIVDSITRLGQQYDENVNIHDWKNLLYVFKNYEQGVTTPQQAIKADVEEIKTSFQPNEWPQVFDALSVGNRTVKDRLLDPKEDLAELINDLSEKVVQKIMDSMDMEEFDIADELVKNYGQSLTRLVEYSSALLQVADEYNDIFHGQHPRLICGGSAGSLGMIRAHLARNQITDFIDVGELDTEIRHMLHFYQEEGGIALDELESAAAMKLCYDNARRSSNPESRILHTHKDPSKFDIQRYNRFDELNSSSGPGKPSLISIAMEFIPDKIFNNDYPGADRSGSMDFMWEDQTGLPDSVILDMREPDRFLWKLVENEYACEVFKRKIRESLEALNEDEMRDRWRKLRIFIRDRYDGDQATINAYDMNYNAEFIHRRYDKWPWWKERKIDI